MLFIRDIPITKDRGKMKFKLMKRYTRQILFMLVSRIVLS